MRKLLVPVVVLTLSLAGIGLAKDKKPVRSKDYKQGVVDAYNCIDFVVAKYKFEGTTLTYVQAVRVCRLHLGIDEIPKVKGGGKTKRKKK